MKNTSLFVLSLFCLYSCTPAKQTARSARKTVIHNTVLSNAYIGISIYEPEKNKYWFNYNSNHYFVPASNVKIATCYAAMKYLGDSLPGIRYQLTDNNTVLIDPTGDPTLLHPDFKRQPVLEMLRNKRHILINTENWAAQPLGSGWSWDDYNDSYMAERSALPVYGNVVRFTKSDSAFKWDESGKLTTRAVTATPAFFRDSIFMDSDLDPATASFNLQRNKESNGFRITTAGKEWTSQQIPFVTNGFLTARKLLRDTLKNDIRTSYYAVAHARTIFSHPTDSVLKPMMHRSDNFLAEQLLLMVSNQALDKMSDAQIIDTLLKTDFKELPQKPRWVDGSGLSRYNLFSPEDFVFILNKMKIEFGMNRIKEIFPTGNEGSLANYYVSDSAGIYAKTGSMSGINSLSGFLYTKKGKLLIFSVIINNHNGSITEVRRAVEKFLQAIRNRH